MINKGNGKKEIIAFFKNGQSAKYTMAIYNMLVTDASVDCIIDAETGEIIEPITETFCNHI